jgi:hypothetical protein
METEAMAKLGSYCKAYVLKQLREFEQWENKLGESALSEDDVVYLQENYTVTSSVFLDENVVFDCVTEEWKTFCQRSLDFQVPVSP